MSPGVFLSLLAYGLFSCADATIKSLGGDVGVFEIGFFTTLFSMIPATLSKPRGESWVQIAHLNHPWLVQLRALAGVLGAASVIYAFTHIPLAEVYSIGFLTPAFILVISALVLKEAVPVRRWFFVLVGFAGVLLVVRPGFREIELGHLAALSCAFFASVTTTVLRVVSPKENRLSIMGVVMCYSLAVNGTLMLLTGFTPPSPEQLLVLAMIGCIGGTGHLLFLGATRLAEANQVAPTQYSQIAWAIVLGALFYREYPDHVAVLGLGVVIGAGLMNLLSEDRYQVIAARLGIRPGRPG